MANCADIYLFFLFQMYIEIAFSQYNIIIFVVLQHEIHSFTQNGLNNPIDQFTLCGDHQTNNISYIILITNPCQYIAKIFQILCPNFSLHYPPQTIYGEWIYQVLNIVLQCQWSNFLHLLNYILL